MNTSRNNDDPQLDAALSRLPYWNPPADFSRRLAAAAHRQNLQQREIEPSLRAGLLLQRVTRATLIVLACTALAALAAWFVAWSGLATRGTALLWPSFAVLLSYSVMLTWRQLRRPGRTAGWSL